MSYGSEGVHTTGSTTPTAQGEPGPESGAAESSLSQEDGPSTDAFLNQRLNAPRGGNTLPWKLLSLCLALALICSLWAGQNVRKLGASSGSQLAESVSVGLKLAPTNLDIRNQSGSALDQALVGNVYESLVLRDSNNKVQPSLASNWTVSEDATTYTFQLNRGITFSNGDKLDADDVAWSISELVTRKYHDAEQLRNFHSIRALNPQTVELKLSAPYADLLWVLSGRPGLVFKKNARYDSKTQALGSGPYTVSQFVPNDSLTLKANPNYWGQHKALTPTLRLRYFADDNAAVNALQSGDVQVLAPISANLTAPFEQDKDRYKLQVGEGTDKYVLAFNGKGEKTSNPAVRQAIRYAIDHQQLIASRGGSDLRLGGPIPKLDPGYEDLSGLYPHDLAKATELMAQAGYSSEHPLKLRLTYANTYGSELGEQLRSQLKPIGIDLQVQVVEFSTWMQNVYTNRDYDLSLVDHSESHDFAQWANPKYYYGYDSPQVQELYQQAMSARSSQESAKLLAQAARQVSQDAPADWLFNYQITTAMLAGVSGFPLSLNQTLMPLWGVSYQPGASQPSPGGCSVTGATSANAGRQPNVSVMPSGLSAQLARPAQPRS
ncbi:ABC transporter substrate-binding protein [Bombiscardovia apis]|uniref:ABC transporter substrate-binding protein n=1 Tax=Bombiscardovia apis TaxID=2932182 RepID=A0ABN6SK76_9BIFI|nr:ABC transporter substrate-binding protein [Bombiscardovia apis]BDR54976.1 ABC transporter substrate-binding protein [Bombiscardovia apis]